MFFVCGEAHRSPAKSWSSEAQSMRWAAAVSGGIGAGSYPDAKLMAVLELQACPICGTPERTQVSPFNGLVLLQSYQDADVARYAYALCHGCGLVYATRRPQGEQFIDLLENFDDNLGRVDRPNLGVVEGSLTDAEKDAIRRRMQSGWMISEERPPTDDEWWPMLRHDRISTADDLTLLASSVDLKGARVLDVRSNAARCSTRCAAGSAPTSTRCPRSRPTSS